LLIEHTKPQAEHIRLQAERLLADDRFTHKATEISKAMQSSSAMADAAERIMALGQSRLLNP
jgi:UDP:flavonoid glycosyltransferase YjiC (YdhE family)